MSTSKTLQETYDSLTGFDEIAIRQQFRTPISALVDQETGDMMLQARALMFVELRRSEQLADPTAYNRVMATPWADVRGYFRNTDDEQLDESAGSHVADYQGEPDPLALGEQPTS